MFYVKILPHRSRQSGGERGLSCTDYHLQLMQEPIDDEGSGLKTVGIRVGYKNGCVSRDWQSLDVDEPATVYVMSNTGDNLSVRSFDGTGVT